MDHLFNDAVKGSGYRIWNVQMISDKIIGMDVKGSGCGPIRSSIQAFSCRIWEEHEQSHTG
jgi:hypothetical protein